MGLYFSGTVDAVEGGGDDTSGVAGAFAAWVEAGDLYVLKGLGVTRDADRRGCAGLYAKKEGFVGVVTVHLLVADLREGIFEPE